jgi:transposase
MVKRAPRTEREIIIDQWQKGSSQTSIAAYLGRSRDFVGDTIRRFEETGSTEDRPRIGRPAKLTTKILQRLKRTAKGKRGKSRKDLSKLVEAEYGVSVHRTTVTKAFHRLGLRSKIRPKQPAATEEQLKARVAWSKHHLHDNYSNWVWLDEKQFLFGQISNRNNDRVWVEDDDPVPPVGVEAQPPRCRVLTGVCSKGLIGPFEYEGSLKSVDYQKLLRDHVIPAVQSKFRNQPWLLVHDRATCHTSASTAAMLADRGIEHMHLPPKSPDLNLVDNLFGIAAENLDHLNPKNVSQFFTFVRRSFDSIPKHVITNMVEHYKRRLKDVISNNGQYSHTY